MSVKGKWYGPYRMRQILFCSKTKMFYEVTGRKAKERLIFIKTMRQHKFHGKWATIRHLNKRYTLTSESRYSVLYGDKTDS